MAEEPISFVISDNGSTERLIELLRAFGLTGDEAIKRIQGALPAYTNAMRAAEDQQKLINAAQNAGIRNTDLLREATNQLNDTELRKAATSRDVAKALQELGAAEQAVTAKARELVQAQQAAAEAAAKVASETKNTTSAFGAGTTVAGAYAGAQKNVKNSHDETANSAKSVNAALQASHGYFNQLIGTVGAYLSVHKLLRDVDAYESIKMSLKAVASQGQDTSAVFMKLGEVAVKSQLPFETVAKSYSQIQGALLKTADGGKSAIPVIENLSLAFYATQTPAAAASRVLHDFAEAMSQGNLGGQQLKSALMQAPQLMALFSDALGKNVSSLTAHAQHTVHLKEKLSDLQKGQEASTTTVFAATSAYDQHKLRLAQTTAEVTKHQNQLEALTAKRGVSAAQIAREEAALKGATDTRTKEAQALNLSENALNRAKAAQAEATIKKEEAIKKTLQNIEALSRENIIAVITGDKFRESINRLAADANGTVKGAFEALNTRFIMWLHTTGSADVTVKAFNVTLDYLGRNLNIIIPLVGALMTALAVAKISAIVTAFKAFAVTIGTTAGAILWWIAVLAIAAVAVYKIIDYFNLWATVTDVLNGAWNIFSGAFKVAIQFMTAAWGLFIEAMRPVGELWGPVLSRIWEQWIKLWGMLKDAWDRALKSVNDLLFDTEGNLTEVGRALKSVAEFMMGAFGNAVVMAITGVVTIITSLATALAGVISFVMRLVEWFYKLVAAAKAAGDAMAGVGSGAGAGGAGGDAAIAQALANASPGARNGASWTVGGASGVDSRFIAVSPGERVTVETPAQYYGHVSRPTSAPVRAAFRDGGSISFSPDQTASEILADRVGQVVSNGKARVSHDAPVTVNNSTNNSNNTTVTNITNNNVTVQAPFGRARGMESIGEGGGGGATTGSASRGGMSATEAQNYRDSMPNVVTDLRHDQVLSIDDMTKQRQSYYDWQKRGPGRFRDGGSFTVPGGSGVDSRLVQLMASPGEEITVTTPAQRAQSAPAQQRRPRDVQVTIITNDAQSFQRSKSQVASDFKRQLDKVV